MGYVIDIDRLREDLMDDYGTAMFNGFPMAVMELSAVERASDEDLLEIAQEQRIDLEDYIIDE